VRKRLEMSSVYCRWARWCRPRKVDSECAAFADPALDPDPSATSPDDTVGEGEAQSTSFSRTLGRKERFEDALERLLVHSTAVVTDGQSDLSGFTVCNCNRPESRQQSPLQ